MNVRMPRNWENEFLWVIFFFFFLINKNLFPKGQSPTKNTHEDRKDPKKRKTDCTSPKTKEKGHQPDTKKNT